MTDVILKFVLSIATILITSYIIPLIKQHIDDNKINKIEEYTELAVRCAEQIYTTDQWKEKKKYVYSYITDKVDEIGLNLNEEDIDLIVEGFVNAVKKG